MATQKPLVIIDGQKQQLPATDVLAPSTLGTGTPNGAKFLRDDNVWATPSGGISLANVISTPTTITADTSYLIVSYLTVDSDLTVNGNLMVIG